MKVRVINVKAVKVTGGYSVSSDFLPERDSFFLTKAAAREAFRGLIEMHFINRNILVKIYEAEPMAGYEWSWVVVPAYEEA